MALTLIAGSGCDDGTCPTVYQDDTTGDVVVQGYLTDAAPALPEGEGAVRIPAPVWKHLLSQLGR